MSAAVGAALKKIAVALLSDKEILKKVLTLLLVFFIAFMGPLFALAALFRGTLQYDSEAFVAEVQANLSAEDILMLTTTEETMTAIEEAFTEAELPDRAGEAQVLYIMALFEKAGEEDFLERLVACFAEDPTDEELVERINTEFDTSIAVSDFTNTVQSIRDRLAEEEAGGE